MPRPYQVRAIKHLVREPFAGLLMDPGMGKTSCVLSAFDMLLRHGVVDRLLVVAPLRPCFQVWPYEVRRWGFDHKVTVLHGLKKDKLLEEARDHEIWVITYEGLKWFAAACKAQKIDLSRTWAIFDESTKIKSTRTQRFKILRPLLPMFRRRTILTGTPSPNGLLDLFGQLYCVDLGKRLGRFITQYRMRWFYQSGFMGYTWLPTEYAEKEIREAISDVCVRLDAREAGLPQYTAVTRFVEMPEKPMKIYRELEREFVAQLKRGLVVASNAGVLSHKLRQAANGGVYDSDRKVLHLHDAKTEAVQDLVEELQGNPLLVAYEFEHDLDRLRKVFPRAPFIKGGMTPKQAIKILDAFNRGEVPVLLCQSAAVAHGLNLQDACHTVCWYGLTWNLENYIQLIKRVHRLGQRARVTVHHVVARGTVDERVMAVLEKKDKTQRALLAGLQKHYLSREAA